MHVSGWHCHFNHPDFASPQPNCTGVGTFPLSQLLGEQVGRPLEALQGTGGLGNTTLCRVSKWSVPCSTVMSFISLACRGTPPRAQWASWPKALDSRHWKWASWPSLS